MFIEFSSQCLVVGFSLIWKKENLAEIVTLCHLFSFVVTRCTACWNSLSLVVIRCTTRCHSLSLVVTRCTTRCQALSRVVIGCHSLHHSLSLVFNSITTRLSFYKRSIQQPFSYLRCFCIKLLVRCLTVQNTYLEKKLLRFYHFFILKKKYLKEFVPQNIFTRRLIFRWSYIHANTDSKVEFFC